MAVCHFAEVGREETRVRREFVRISLVLYEIGRVGPSSNTRPA